MYSIANWVSGMPTEFHSDYTLNFARANLGALLLAIPVCAAYILLYSLVYGWNQLGVDLQSLFNNPLIFLLVFAVGIGVHEGIHALSWAGFDDIPWKHIHFGFQWSTITPYVHCSAPVRADNYRWGTALPGISLGIIPYLLALILHDGWLLGFGLLFTLAAGGDFLILWLLRDVDSTALVQDHPELIGCIVIEPEDG